MAKEPKDQAPDANKPGPLSDAPPPPPPRQDPPPPPPSPEEQQQAQQDGSRDAVTVEGPRTNTRGAQVILTGEAQEAARGGFGDIEQNTLVKRSLEADGTVADGTTPDGSTATGKPAPDVVVTEQAKPGGEKPAEQGTTRVEVRDPPAQPGGDR